MPTERQRRQAAQRRLARQLARRQAQARKRRQRYAVAGSAFAVVVVVVLVLIFATDVFSGSNKKASASSSASPSTTTSASASPTPTASPFPTHTFAKAARAARATSGPCHYAETKTSRSSTYTKDVGLPPDPKPTPRRGRVTVSLTSSQGPLTLTLDRADAPCAVQSFAYLVRKGLYANTTCPRLTTNGIYVLQCGDPSNTQQGGATYSYKQEINAHTKYTAGVVAMANTGKANSTGSQFFIIYKNSTGLPKKYSVIGTVSKGLSTVQKVARGGSDNANGSGDGKPVLGMTIKTAKLT